jgi:uncharacterized protein YcfJ
MLKPQILALCALALAVTACGSDPVSYSEPRYVSGSSYNSGAYSDSGRVVAIDVVRGSGSTSGGGAVLGGIVGGVLGHQIGSGSGNTIATVGGTVPGGVVGSQVGRSGQQQAQTRDVQRCASVPSQTPDHWDVSYTFRGQEHRIQTTTPPGQTVTVNGRGEPRAS